MVQIRAETRSDARRAEILKKASEMFGRKGFHGAGMREIARALGLAPGALYYYFPSKDDLLAACQMLALEKLLASGREVAAADAPPAEKIRRLVAGHLEHVLRTLGGGLAHVEFGGLPPDRLAEVVEKRDEYERIVRGLIAEGVRAGAFRKVDVKLAALALLGALNWAVVWWRPDGEWTVEAVAASVADLILGGLTR